MNQIVSLSGGKDSTAMLLMMIELKEPIHSIVFFNTGWEFPQMSRHIKKLQKYINIPIIELKPKKSFNDETMRYSWPRMNFRHCTGLKINALVTYHSQFKPYISCRGFASNEKQRTLKKTKIHKNCIVRYPLLEWNITEKNALIFCKKHGFHWDGLYDHFNRVSCYCCPLKKIDDYRILRKYYPKLWQKILTLDRKIINNRGFHNYKTAHFYEKRFSHEDKTEEKLIKFCKGIF